MESLEIHIHIWLNLLLFLPFIDPRPVQVNLNLSFKVFKLVQDLQINPCVYTIVLASPGPHLNVHPAWRGTKFQGDNKCYLEVTLVKENNTAQHMKTFLKYRNQDIYLCLHEVQFRHTATLHCSLISLGVITFCNVLHLNDIASTQPVKMAWLWFTSALKSKTDLGLLGHQLSLFCKSLKTDSHVKCFQMWIHEKRWN